jgi:hypothetical protein
MKEVANIVGAIVMVMLGMFGLYVEIPYSGFVLLLGLFWVFCL